MCRLFGRLLLVIALGGLLTTGCTPAPESTTGPADSSPKSADGSIPEPSSSEAPTIVDPPQVTTDYKVGDPVDDDKALGRLCGSRGLAPCPDDMFCDFPDGSDCGATDRGGRCALRPEMCTKQYDPVCSCRGETFGNLCMAHAAGVDADREGPCPSDEASR